MDLSITKKQKAFIDAQETEVLFGGAAGGGKSYAQCIDAMLYALRFPKSKQLLLRRTFPELEMSILRTVRDLYPADKWRYNVQQHVGRFPNGSMIDFGYINSEMDLQRYQSAEFDVIRFDELTHFTEEMYRYLFSRLRGANTYPKQIKSSTNPGNVGHSWVKARFIDPAPPDTVITTPQGTRRFIPSKVQDNVFLMNNDPDYIARLKNLSETEQKALLYGDWDVFEGQYFTEWSAELHTMDPVPIQPWWQVYRALDYGLDRLACLWCAFDEVGNAYVFRELCVSNTIVSDAARMILSAGDEPVTATFMPSDLLGRSSQTGVSIYEAFANAGLQGDPVSNPRVPGWLNLKEWLHPRSDGAGNVSPRLKIFSTCTELIRCLPQLQYAKTGDPSDVAKDPHDITHAPDALRYMMDGRPRPGEKPKEERHHRQPVPIQRQAASIIAFGGRR